MTKSEAAKVRWAKHVFPYCPPGTKICSKCKGEPKPYSEFQKNKSSKDGYANWCRKCHNKNWETNKDFYNRNNKARYSPKERRARTLAQYGWTEESYQAKLAEQDSKCAICKEPMLNGRYAKPNVDHCHASNKTRGLLCTTCNRLLGYAYDSIDVLVAAADYLRRYS